MFKSPGAICEQFVKCGKAGCRCNDGELHGPYHYLFFRDELGRLRKRYVKRGEVTGKRAELAAQKAKIAVDNARWREVLPPKRTRNYDLLTTVGRMALVFDRAFGRVPKQQRNPSGQFVRVADRT